MFAGCGDMVGLKGKVVYSDDGSPVSTGTIYFETDSYLARGEIKPDGSFVVGSAQANDGLPPGKYRVSFSDVQSVTVSDGNGPEKTVSLIDEKYNSGKTSGIEVEVTKSMRPLAIEVDRVVKK